MFPCLDFNNANWIQCINLVLRIWYFWKTKHIYFKPPINSTDYHFIRMILNDIDLLEIVFLVTTKSVLSSSIKWLNARMSQKQTIIVMCLLDAIFTHIKHYPKMYYMSKCQHKFFLLIKSTMTFKFWETNQNMSLRWNEKLCWCTFYL